MIKKVNVDQIKVGMFIHSFDCGWLEHPFFNTSVKVKNDKMIEKIVKHGIREVYIDTERGLDVVDAPVEEEVKKEINIEISKAAETKAAENIPLQEELIRARKIKDNAKQIVKDIMEDIRIGRQIEMEKIDPIVEKMADSIFRNKDALMSLGKIKHMDDYTFLHSVSVCVFMISFCKSLGFDRSLINKVGVGALLHDIGKVNVPIEILNKSGGLTDEEFAKVKDHVVQGSLILSQTQGISDTSILVAAQHHERFDGSGYPNGLKGSEISKLGQMAAIVDVYDAITSDRCYHKGMESSEAIRKIFEWSKYHFNQDLVQKYIQCVGIYPIGATVRLESGLLGVVIEPGTESLLRPIIRVVYNTKKERFTTPEDIDLSKTLGKGGGDKIVGYEQPERWNIDPYRYLEAYL
ncbi:MAG: HD-GYP domain-containing protein [Thermodesulfovibrionales bacterium]|nr:HD-GYP domain-containing protein [Thermodesulfovibrionales bacterium]